VKTILASLCVFLTASSAYAEQLDVARSYFVFDPDTAQPAVVVLVTSGSGETLTRITQDNVGRKVSIRLNDRVLMEPVIRAPIVNRYLLLTGGLETKWSWVLLGAHMARDEVIYGEG